MGSKPSRKIFFYLALISFFQIANYNVSFSETADSTSILSVPRPRARPSNLNSAPEPSPSTPSITPFPRPNQLNPEQIAALQARPCPGGEYCPSLPADFNSQCSNFIDSNGSYPGDGLGILMLEAMQEVEQAHASDAEGTNGSQCSFFENINLTPACPNFRYMTPLQKQHVWVWTWAAVAQAESSCNPNVEARGIENTDLGRYEVADGLYGLERHFDSRESNGRDPRFCPHESIADTKNLFFQSRCAASIMYDKHCQGPSVVNSNSYWLQFRDLRGKITRLIQKHPLCNPEQQNSILSNENLPSS